MRPRQRERVSRGVLEPLADGVNSARATGSALYTLSVVDATGRMVLRRHSPVHGAVERQVVLGAVCGWAVSEHGLLLAVREGPSVVLQALGPDLTLRSSRTVATPRDPVLAVQDGVAWAMVFDPQIQQVGPAQRLPWGEIASVSVEVVRLGDPPGAPRIRSVVGRSGFWYVREDDATRRLLDPAAASGALLRPVGDGIGAGIVLGGPVRARKGLGAMLGDGAAASPQQSLHVATPVGTQQLGDRRPGPDTAWVQQMAHLPGTGPWYLSTTAGLETTEVPGQTGDRWLYVARPPAGAARWVPAGSLCFGVVMDQILPNRGVSVHVVLGGRRRELGRWPALLGNLASVRVTESARIVAGAGRMWLGVANEAGGSDLLRADAEGASVLASAPGWLEPVGTSGETLFALHAPGSPPGDSRATAGRLVRVRSG